MINDLHPLAKVILILALFFAGTLLLGSQIAWFDFDAIEQWLRESHGTATWRLGLVISGLLLLDLLITVPTMSLTLLAGYLLGYPSAILFVLIGLFAAGTAGYGLGRWRGNWLLTKLIPQQDEQHRLQLTFERIGMPLLLVCRAVPMLPEITACLAGIAHMRFASFVLLWAANSIPYTLVVAYAGSISTLKSPWPALATSIGLTLVLWTGGFFLHRRLDTVN